MAVTSGGLDKTTDQAAFLNRSMRNANDGTGWGCHVRHVAAHFDLDRGTRRMICAGDEKRICLEGGHRVDRDGRLPVGTLEQEKERREPAVLSQ